MENDTSPVTPKKRYSCISEYTTPMESDESVYYSPLQNYSFVVSEDAVNKENSINGGQWTITETTNSPTASRVSKAKTPLLRKVLQTNYTPRNKNNKRVSFSHIPKPSPIPKTTEKNSKTNNLDNRDCDRTVSFDLKPIEKSLPIVTKEELKDIKSYEKIENDTDSNTANESSLDTTDDLHNTIIENSTAAGNSTSGEEFITSQQSVTLLEKKGQFINYSELKNNVSHKSNAANTRTVEEIIYEDEKNVLQTKNTARINRQRLAYDNRKSLLPVTKKQTRFTTYKRRSSTYELRKVDPRKSLGALKQVASKVTKTMVLVQKNPLTTANSTGCTNHISVSATTNPTLTSENIPAKQAIKKNVADKRMVTLKARKTLANQPPTVPIVSTHQSNSMSIRAQRRETKNSLTSLALAKTSISSDRPVDKTSFVKPIGVSIRSKSTTTTSATTTSNGNGKCKYCDKFFAKSHGMSTHLLENCEKIPSSARRQLLQKEKTIDNANSKQVSRRKTFAIRQDNDSIPKYSRFFVSLTNEDGAVIDVENGLKNLRAELRKIKGPHAGITRTPSKTIRCHICNKLFLDCVEYADHTTNHPPL